MCVCVCVCVCALCECVCVRVCVCVCICTPLYKYALPPSPLLSPCCPPHIHSIYDPTLQLMQVNHGHTDVVRSIAHIPELNQVQCICAYVCTLIHVHNTYTCTLYCYIYMYMYMYSMYFHMYVPSHVLYTTYIMHTHIHTHTHTNDA